VIVDDKDLYGDAVNIAARLENFKEHDVSVLVIPVNPA